MNFEYYISKRFLKENKKRFSQTAIKLSILSIGFGLAIMILSMSIVTGFQKNVRAKISAFDGDIQITKYDFNNSMELPPIDRDSNLEHDVISRKGIKSISAFAYKGGLIKTKEVIQGTVFKGVDKNYNWNEFKKWIFKGRLPNIGDTTKSKEIIISKNIAQKLNLDVDSSFLMYFMQNPPKIKKLTVVGVYESGFPDFDNKFILGDIKQIQNIDKWTSNQIAGYEVLIDDFSKMTEQTNWIYDEINYDLKAQNIYQRYPFIMDWLNLLDTNVYFILGLLILISSIGMIATMLILILERTQFIGIMKAMGATNYNIRKIFIYHAIFLTTRGLIIGNVLGISIALAQFYFKIIPLDASTYYMDSVPINISWTNIISLNIVTILIITIIMWWPSHIISKIAPIKAIRYI